MPQCQTSRPCGVRNAFHFASRCCNALVFHKEDSQQLPSSLVNQSSRWEKASAPLRSSVVFAADDHVAATQCVFMAVVVPCRPVQNSPYVSASCLAPLAISSHCGYGALSWVENGERFGGFVFC